MVIRNKTAVEIKVEIITTITHIKTECMKKKVRCEDNNDFLCALQWSSSEKSLNKILEYVLDLPTIKGE